MKEICKLFILAALLMGGKRLMAENFKLVSFSASSFAAEGATDAPAYGDIKYEISDLCQVIASSEADIVCIEDFSDYTSALHRKIEELTDETWYCRHCIRDCIILSKLPILPHKGVFFNPIEINENLTLHLCCLQYGGSGDMLPLARGGMRNCIWEHVKEEINYYPYPNDNTMLCVGQFDDSFVKEGAPRLSRVLEQECHFRDAFLEVNKLAEPLSRQRVYFRSPFLRVVGSRFLRSEDLLGAAGGTENTEMLFVEFTIL